MRIGIDMYLAQQGDRSPSGVYADALVRELVSTFSTHEWFLYFHPTLGGMADFWRQRAAVREAPNVEGPRGLPNGQTAAAQAVDDVDVWLTTTALDWRGDYLPPSTPFGRARLAGLLLDLAPVLAPDRFVNRPITVERYRQGVFLLPRYDLLLTVLDATRHECTHSLGVDAAKITAIGAAGSPSFFPPERGPSFTGSLPVGVRRPFVLCLAGDNEDRSIAVLAAALELCKAEEARGCQYVVLSRMSDVLRAVWRQELVRRGMAERLVLVDAEGNEIQRTLFQNCTALIDAEPHEGSGLMLLCALQCGAPAIVDQRSCHADLAAEAAVLADIDQPVHLAASLDRLLVDAEQLESLRLAGPAVAARYSMAAAAERAVKALEGVTRRDEQRQSLGEQIIGMNRQRVPSQATRVVAPRASLAFFSPLLPQRTGIADYSERLLTALKHHFRIDLYHDEGYLPQLSVSSTEFGCRDRRLFDLFRRATDYAGIVYQMANTHFCAYLYEMLLKHRGLVVLHDFALPEFHLGYSFRRGVPENFLEQEIAVESAALADEYRSSSAAWRAEPGGLAQAFIRRGLSFNRRILEAAGIIVVHDRWGADQIGGLYPQLAERVRLIPHGTALHTTSPEEKRAVRERFGIPQDELILSCFGILNGAKYHSEAIEALAALRDDFPQARLIFVGGDLNEGREQLRAAELGVADRVRFFGHAPMETFLELMSVSDLALNLRRPPTRGETSGALLTLLSAGVPTIVTAVDAFASYPDTVVRKIAPLARQDRTLEHAIRGLLNEPERRRELGRAAAKYVAEVHNWQRVAALYADAVDALRSTSPAAAARRVVRGPRFALRPVVTDCEQGRQ
ncbi:MAG TPA: glycosyltransferase [Pirellulales bacterium]|nr:glycosyltransferase [Pirellulales bacterium]